LKHLRKIYETNLKIEKEKGKENIKRKKAAGRLTGPAPEEAHGPAGQETRIGTPPNPPSR
jgi:hypothetical protein